jgi:hypothetical protein
MRHFGDILNIEYRIQKLMYIKLPNVTVSYMALGLNVLMGAN